MLLNVCRSGARSGFPVAALAPWSQGLMCAQSALSSIRNYNSAISIRPFGLHQQQHSVRTALLLRRGFSEAFFDVEATWAAADGGEAAAQSALGECYLYGRGVPRDVVEGARLVRLAVEQGHAKAQYNLGQCYASGTGVVGGADPAEAARLYALAADQGLPEAMHNLAVILEGGVGVPQDRVRAAQLLRRSAELGHAPSCHNYGLLLADGCEIAGVSQDAAQSVVFFKRAADAGVEQSQFNYAVRLATGTGVAQNLSEAARYYRLAAEAGFPQAQYNLGMCLWQAQGVAQDSAEAAIWFERAAETGERGAEGLSAAAQCALGMVHGATAPQLGSAELSESARWYGLAAAQGSAVGQYGLANFRCLQMGHADDEAVRLYRAAAAQGLPGAETALGSCAMRGEGMPQDFEEGVRRFRAAAARGHGEGAAHLAKCYEHGIGIQQNSEMAARWNKWAMKCGYNPQQ